MSTPAAHAEKSASPAKQLVIALAGNPNSGKTTAFNAFTGAQQHVANYPGITVEKKEGIAKVKGASVRVIDLPGTYSLTAYSQEEVVARRVLIEEKPDMVLDVINAGALERNLYLAVQLLEMGIPVTLALNMMDEAVKQGLTINAQLLSELLGVPVVETVARNGKGLPQALETACNAALAQQGKSWTPLNISYGTDMDLVLESMESCIQQAGLFTDIYPARWLALKFLENDEDIRRQVKNSAPEIFSSLAEQAKELSQHLAATAGTYPEALIADYRYGFISSILRQGVIIRREDPRHRIALSDRMDKVLTHTLAGPLIMLGVLYLIYLVTFVLGEIPMGWVENFFGWANETASGALPDGLLKSLIVSGIIDGVGGVLGFVPLIFVMFLFISFLEDSGYMARVAYMLDRVFRIFGLHGSSIMPFIVSGGIAGGCAVPGVLAARTLRSPKEKLATVLTVPFLACGAKIPVFLLFVGVFFAENQARTMFLLTLTGWVFALLVARLLRSTVIKGAPTPFVMELPPYRMPTGRGVLIHTWERTWMYIKKAGTIILAISVLLWAAMTFPQLPEEQVERFEEQRAVITAQMETLDESAEDEIAALEESLAEIDATEAGDALLYSIAGRVGTALEGVTGLAGFDWQTNIALVGGIAAKEVIVSTLGTAYSLGEVDPEEAESLSGKIAADPNWTSPKALGLMLFVMLYAPCFVTLVAIRRETGSWRWPVFSLIFNTILAFVVAVLVYQIGTALI